MDISEVKAFLEENKDSEEVKALFKSAPLSLEEYLKLPEGQKVFDSKVSQSIATYRDKTLPGLVEQEKKKIQDSMNPSLTPEMKEIQELRKMLEDKNKSEQRANWKSKVVKILSEKGIPTELADFSLSDTEEETDSKLAMLLETTSKYGQKIREEVLSGHKTMVPTPSAADNLKKDSTDAPPSGASKEQLKDYYRAQANKSQ